MATRNERKRRAKARHAELKAAVEQAFEQEKREKHAFEEARANYAARVEDALRFHRNPVVRRGKIIGGHFVAVQAKEPEKRKLVRSQTTGKMIERRKTYI